MKNLIIVESPTKARTLSRFLGEGYEISSSIGHIRDLPKSKLGVDTERDFKPEYVLVEGKGKVVKELQTKAKQAKAIYLAMDPDREGEAIAWHLRYALSKSGDGKFKRITFHQITADAVKEAISKAHGIDLKLMHAQQARRVLDRLVGYKLSPVLWKKIRRGLSAGRVQSVTVRLIVEREEEIEKFKPVEYWEIRAELKKDKNFLANLVEIDGKGVKKGEFLVTGKNQAGRIVADLQKAGYVVSEVKREERTRNPYPPFTTSTMQQAGANVFGWSAKKTMGVAQKLYERGKITYHRTDSVNIAKAAVARVRKFIGSEYGEKYLPESPRFYKSKSKLAQEAHEAIRPTNVNSKFEIRNSKFKDDMEKLYKLVWQRFVASQMSKAIYDATTIDVVAKRKAKSEQLKTYLLRVSGSIRKFDGWRVLYKRSKDDVELPELKQGDELDLVKVLSDQKFTQPPPRFNDASLVKELEKRGIGRPSTYAPTISTIIVRGYIERKERRFYPTVVGVTVTKFLVKNFETVLDYDFTAEMEDDLDKIAEGEKKWVPVVKEFWGPFKKKVKEVEEKAKRVKVPVEKTGKLCPKCGKSKKGEEVIRTGRFGKFLSCSRFPDCDHTASYTELVKGVKCPDCGGKVVMKKTRRGKMFYGCSNYPECKWASWKDPRQKSHANRRASGQAGEKDGAGKSKKKK